MINAENYRDEVVSYFDKVDSTIASILRKNKNDFSFPFRTVHVLSEESNIKNSDLRAFLNFTTFFHKYRPAVNVKKTFEISSRGDFFLKRIISENEVYATLNRFIISVFVAEKIVEELVKENGEFDWFIPNKGVLKNEPEYIIIDTMNILHKIKEYDGKNKILLQVKKKIGPLTYDDGINFLIDFFTENLNGNNYRLIFVTPTTKKYSKHFLGDKNFFVVSIDCKTFFGENCSHISYSNETDDCVLLLLYDYIFFQKEHKISILSGDNYDFSIITHDFLKPYCRAIIATQDGNESTILSWEDIIYENAIFSFENRKLTIFEEELENGSIR